MPTSPPIGARLVIEVDGVDHTTDAAIIRDARRDAFIRAEGYRVLRFNAGDMLNRLDAVYLAICAVALAPTHHAPRGSPSPQGGGSAD